MPVRRMYAAWLTQAGFSVTEAHNGLQALERAFESVPDIAVTGYAAFQADPGRAIRAGCDAVLEKPCSPDDLEATIRTLINGRRH